LEKGFELTVLDLSPSKSPINMVHAASASIYCSKGRARHAKRPAPGGPFYGAGVERSWQG
jgi:hypothetical protein